MTFVYSISVHCTLNTWIKKLFEFVSKTLKYQLQVYFVLKTHKYAEKNKHKRIKQILQLIFLLNNFKNVALNVFLKIVY